MTSPSRKQLKAINAATSIVRRLIILLLPIVCFGQPVKVTPGIAIHLPDKEVIINKIRKIGGYTWVASMEGLYRIQGNTSELIGEQNLDVTEIVEVGGNLWATTNRGAFIIRDTKMQQVTDSNSGSYFFFPPNGQMWIFGRSGVYRVDGETVKRIPTDEGLSVNDLQFVDNQIWLFGVVNGSTHESTWLAVPRLYRIDGDVLQPILTPRMVRLYGIYSINGQALVIADTSIYRVDGNGLQKIGDLPKPTSKHNQDGTIDYTGITASEIINGQLWVWEHRTHSSPEGTASVSVADGAYLVDGASVRRLFPPDEKVERIEDVSGRTLIITNKYIYWLDGQTPKQIKTKAAKNDREIWIIDNQVWIQSDEGISQIVGDAERLLGNSQGLHLTSGVRINDELWIAASDRLYRLVGNNLQPTNIETPKSSSLIVINGHLWAETQMGAFHYEGSGFRRVPDVEIKTEILDVNGQTWLSTNKGAFRFDENVLISVDPVSTDSWWTSLVGGLFPNNVWVSGVITPRVQYQNSSGSDPYPQSFPRQFGVIVETSEQRRTEAIKNNEYSSPNRVERSVGGGKITFYMSVRDSWGNRLEREATGWVVPSLPLLSGAVAFSWLLILVVIVLLAPYSQFSHDLLMNPWVRNYGSFGLVPLTLTVIPGFRRHLLRRYLRGLREDKDFAEWKQRFILPADIFMPEHFGRNLEQQRKLLLLGDSGIGKTSYFRYLTLYHATEENGSTPPKNITPVFIPVGRYRESEPLAMFQAQLSNYGRLTDRELSAWFLKQGSFLILIDGLNEVDEITRGKINSFVDEHWKANYFCISSQQNYSQFSGVEPFRLTSLSPDKVDEFIRCRLGIEMAERAIKQFTPQTYEIYKIPQDLEFAIEILRRDFSLPLSREELYGRVLDPLLNLWTEGGQTDYPTLLFQRAYEMLAGGEVVFDRHENPLPNELRETLVANKFLKQRGDQYLFRHDLIRAYLASRYFLTRWQDLLGKDDLVIDYNWLPMLQFTLLKLQHPNTSKQILGAVLVRNKKVAGVLFTWMGETSPTLRAGWEQEFKLKYAEALLGEHNLISV